MCQRFGAVPSFGAMTKGGLTCHARARSQANRHLELPPLDGPAGRQRPREAVGWLDKSAPKRAPMDARQTSGPLPSASMMVGDAERRGSKL